MAYIDRLQGETKRPEEPWSLEQLEKIPHLHAVAKAIRSAIAATTVYLSDIELLNELDFEYFLVLFNNNLLFRLIITHDYYLLLTLFKDPSEKARWINFLNEVRMEERNHDPRFQQSALPFIIKPSLFLIPEHMALREPVFLWTHADPKLSNHEKWQHYERELQRITFEYHVQRIQVLSQALRRESEYIANVIRILRQDEAKNAWVIGELDGIDGKIQRQLQEITNIRIDKFGDLLDIQEAQHKNDQLELLRSENSIRMAEMLFNVENSEVKALGAERIKDREKVAVELREIDEVYIKINEEIEPYLTELTLASKEGLKMELAASVEKLKNIEQDDRLIRDLEKLTLELEQVQDFISFNRIVTQFNVFQNQSNDLLKKTAGSDEVKSEQPQVHEPNSSLSASSESHNISENRYRFSFSMEEQRHKQMDLKERSHADRLEAEGGGSELINQGDEWRDACSKIVEIWENIKGINQFSTEDIDKVNEINQLLIDIINNNISVQSQKKIDLIIENIANLGEDYNGVDVFLEELNLFQKITEQEPNDNMINFGSIS